MNCSESDVLTQYKVKTKKHLSSNDSQMDEYFKFKCLKIKKKLSLIQIGWKYKLKSISIKTNEWQYCLVICKKKRKSQYEGTFDRGQRFHSVSKFNCHIVQVVSSFKMDYWINTMNDNVVWQLYKTCHVKVVMKYLN
jgi:hypothetical protein